MLCKILFLLEEIASSFAPAGLLAMTFYLRYFWNTTLATLSYPLFPEPCTLNPIFLDLVFLTLYPEPEILDLVFLTLNPVP
jgi:hypothetical protein